MVNPARGWCSLHRVALVVVGWLLFASALVTANPLLKGLFLVAARALPQALWDRSRIGPHLSLDCPRRASTSVGSRRLTPRVSPCLSAFGRRVPTMVCGVSCVRIPLGTPGSRSEPVSAVRWTSGGTGRASFQAPRRRSRTT